MKCEVWSHFQTFVQTKLLKYNEKLNNVFIFKRRSDLVQTFLNNKVCCLIVCRHTANYAERNLVILHCKCICSELSQGSQRFCVNMF